MKNVIFRFLAALFVIFLAANVPAGAEKAENVHFSQGETYYHRLYGCGFGAADSFFYLEESVLPEDEAQSAGLRACPACARDWQPVFSGDFPEWTNEIQPWQLGFQNADLPFSVLSAWGNIADVLYEMESLPEDYAGVYRNACGGYTLLLVNPTMERVEELSELTGCEFWVLSADYSQSALENLQDAAISLMGGKTGVHTLSLDTVGNRIQIGVDPLTENSQAEIVKALADMGFADHGMYTIEAQSPGDPDF